MCEFISWKEVKTKEGTEILFLTSNDIYNTKRGKELQKHTTSDDFIGHGAIDFYFEIGAGKGIEKECTDFSSPDNFPKVISDAIKAGNFRGLETPYQLLTQPALAKYEAIEKDALAKYQATQQPALAKYQAIKKDAFWDLFAVKENRNPLWR
jgi:hypothetical protein